MQMYGTSGWTWGHPQPSRDVPSRDKVAWGRLSSDRSKSILLTVVWMMVTVLEEEFDSGAQITLLDSICIWGIGILIEAKVWITCLLVISLGLEVVTFTPKGEARLAIAKTNLFKLGEDPHFSSLALFFGGSHWYLNMRQFCGKSHLPGKVYIFAAYWKSWI